MLTIRRHKYTLEALACLLGRFVEEFYDELERICTDAIELTLGGLNFLVIVPDGQWQTCGRRRVDWCCWSRWEDFDSDEIIYRSLYEKNNRRKI